MDPQALNFSESDTQTVNFSSSNAHESVYIMYNTSVNGDDVCEMYIKKIKNLTTGSVYEENGYSSNREKWTVHFFPDGKKIEQEFFYDDIHPGTIFKDCRLLKDVNTSSKNQSPSTALKNFAVKKSLVKIK